MDLSYVVLGSYFIRLQADDFKRFWSICMYHGLTFRYLEANKENEYYCQIRCDRYEKLAEIAQKTQINIQILKKRGFPFWFDMLKLHIWFFAGAVMALFLLYYLSGCLWNIRVDGNCYYGKEVIERFLKEQNISCGMRISNIACADLAADIRTAFPKVTWASCEINGCDLIVHVKENVLFEAKKEEMKGAYDLVADKNGIIDDILVRQGIAQVEIGQFVKKGDVLISGYIPIENDAMEVIAYEPVVSDGDIIISSEYSYFEEIDRIYEACYVLDEVKLPYFMIGEISMEGLWLKKVMLDHDSDQYLDEYVSKKEMKITDSFHLPIQWGKKTQRIYEKYKKSYSDEELMQLSEEHFHIFCTNLEKKGVQIYENNVKMELSDASCTRKGNLTVLETTGELKKSEEIVLDDDKMEE